MPRTLDAPTTTEKNRTDADWFLTAAFQFSTGTVRVAEDDVTIGAETFDGIVVDWGQAATDLFHFDATSLPARTATITLVNARVLNADADRFSDYLRDRVEGTRVEIKLRFRDSVSAIHTVAVFTGALLGGPSWGYDRVTVTVGSLGEKYLSKQVLETVDGEFFTDAREEDGGATVPLLFGDVDRSPGRVVDQLNGVIVWSESPSGNVVQSIDKIEASDDGAIWYELGDDAVGDISEGVTARSLGTSATGGAAVAELFSPHGALGSGLDLFGTGDNAKAIIQEFRIRGSGTAVVTSLVVFGISTIDLNASKRIQVYLLDRKPGDPFAFVDRFGNTGSFGSPGLESATLPGLLGGATARLSDWPTSAGENILFPIHARTIERGRSYYIMIVPGSGIWSSTDHLTVGSSNTSAEDQPSGAEVWTKSVDSSWQDAADFGGLRAGVSVEGEVLDGDEILGEFAVPFSIDTARLVEGLSVRARREEGTTTLLRARVVADSATDPDGDTKFEVAFSPSDATTTLSVISKQLPEAVLLPPGDYHVIFGAAGVIDNNGGEAKLGYLYAAYTDESEASKALRRARTGGAGLRYWERFPARTGEDFLRVAWRLDICTITNELSVDDGRGVLVARTTFGCDVGERIQFAADVTGIQRRRPDDWAQFLLNRSGLVNADLDLAGSFAEAASLYTADERFDGGVYDHVTYAQLLLKGAKESRSAFIWPFDKAEWHYLPDPTATADVTPDDDDVRVDDRNRPAITITKSAETDIVNVIELLYDLNPLKPAGDEKSYRKSLTKRDTASITDYEELRRPELFRFDLVRNATFAGRVAQYWLVRLAEAKELLRVEFKLEHLEIAPLDVMELTLLDDVGAEGAGSGYGEGGYGGGGFGGAQAQLSRSRKWLVEGVGYEWGPGDSRSGNIIVSGRAF